MTKDYRTALDAAAPGKGRPPNAPSVGKKQMLNRSTLRVYFIFWVQLTSTATPPVSNAARPDSFSGQLRHAWRVLCIAGAGVEWLDDAGASTCSRSEGGSRTENWENYRKLGKIWKPRTRIGNSLVQRAFNSKWLVPGRDFLAQGRWWCVLRRDVGIHRLVGWNLHHGNCWQWRLCFETPKKGWSFGNSNFFGHLILVLVF